MIEKSCGCHDCNCDTPHKTIARQNPKYVSPPAQCKTCIGQFYIFEMPGHPDDGEVFACGIMLENVRENGNRPFPCSYRQTPEIAPIIDAELEQKKRLPVVMES